MQKELFSLSHAGLSGAHAWRSSITPIDQLLCQASQFLMSCEKTQWNKSRYQANKLLKAVLRFYLFSCSNTWHRFKGVELRKGGEAVAFQLSDFYELYCGL